MASQKRIPLVFVLLPIAAVLGIVGMIGWNLYKDYQRSEAEDQEARRLLELAQQEKIKAAKAQVEAQHPTAPVEEEDELGKLPGQRKKAQPKPVANLTPSQKAYNGFKSAYDKLEAANESAARKFRARKLQLDDQFNDGKPKNESKFVADCEATKNQILEQLRNPENQ